MLLTGETYTTSVGKARPESVDETYAAIEEDLSFGRDHLGLVTHEWCNTDV